MWFLVTLLIYSIQLYNVLLTIWHSIVTLCSMVIELVLS